MKRNKKKKTMKEKMPSRLSLKGKLTLSLSSIAAVLLLTSIISFFEYRRMSNYVSDMVAANIKSINVAQRLAANMDKYNLGILAAVGEDELGELPEFDEQAFFDQCDSLRLSLGEARGATPMADTTIYAFTAYMLTSMELGDVLQSEFINTRDWYFDRLQPSYNRLREYLDALTEAAYLDLQENSLNYQDSFYRSIVPGVVSVGVGLILVILLYIFLMAYYAGPLYKMLKGLNDYDLNGTRYSNTFEGDDEMADLNRKITDIIGENIEMKRRINLFHDVHREE